MTRAKRRIKMDTFVVGGLHKDDFAKAAEMYDEAGYVLIGFQLDVDSYHWKAFYVKAEQLDQALRGGTQFALD